MELFIIYVITRLTELKETLLAMGWWLGIGLGITIVVRVVNEFIMDSKYKKPEDPADGDLDFNTYGYRRVRAITKRGLFFFVPLFALVLTTNTLLPSSRDAVVIAGGYGLVEAVKNERVQRLFNKSASVAGHWLDAQLNDDVEAEKAAKAESKSKAKAADDEVEEAPAEEEVKPKKKARATADEPAEKLDPKVVAAKVTDRVVERVTDELLGPAKK